MGWFLIVFWMDVINQTCLCVEVIQFMNNLKFPVNYSHFLGTFLESFLALQNLFCVSCSCGAF